ncbi:unnamed protein product [Mucor hiemalis]
MIFNFTRDNSDDILLVPAIIEKLSQIKEIILATISNLYQCNNGDEESVDLTPLYSSSVGSSSSSTSSRNSLPATEHKSQLGIY